MRVEEKEVGKNEIKPEILERGSSGRKGQGKQKAKDRAREGKRENRNNFERQPMPMLCALPKVTTTGSYRRYVGSQPGT